MGTHMDFINTDGEGIANEDNKSKPLLARQSSLYFLTFDELQNTFGEPGKDFGSMNMDELLKNIWTVEERQAIMTMTTTPTVAGAQPCILQRQGSLNLPTTLGQKTVDEVWKNLTSKESGGNSEMGSRFDALGRQQTLRGMTLEDFLLCTGVMREDDNKCNQQIESTKGFYDNKGASADLGFEFGKSNENNISFSGDNKSSMISNEAPGSGLKVGETMQQQPHKRLCRTIFPKQANANMVNKSFFKTGADCLGRVGVTVATTSSGTSSAENNTWSSPPVSYALEKVVERRQKRMIKNRESAARSRARKQAYTLELEAEIENLKQVNQDLQLKQAEIMKTHLNELKESSKQCPWVAKRECLRRTLTGPW